MIIIVGCGTLGSRVAYKIKDDKTLIDHDLVAEENLNTQLYDLEDVGSFKAEVLAKKTCSEYKTVFIDNNNITLLKNASVVIDCTDNLQSRRVIGEYCYKQAIPVVSVAASGKKGFFIIVKRPHRLDAVYEKKISVGDCKGRSIDVRLADKLACMIKEAIINLEQESSRFCLVYENAINCYNINKTTTTEKNNIELRFCTQDNCFKARHQNKNKVTPRKFMLNNVIISVQEDGEIAFHNTTDPDLCQELASVIYNKI